MSKQDMLDKGTYLQTVGRALDVLGLFIEENGLTLSVVAERLRLNTTVAYRLLHTLAACDFLRQDPESKRFYLGERAVALGYRAIQSQELKSIAPPILKELFEQTRLDVMLTIFSDWKSLCIEKLDSIGDLHLAMKTGGLYPLHKGASNRPLLAFLPELKREHYLTLLRLSPEALQRLRGQLDDIVRCGYDRSAGTLTPGLFAIGFPVFDMGNQMTATVSVGGYASEVSEEEAQELLHATRQAAARLSRALGSTLF